MKITRVIGLSFLVSVVIILSNVSYAQICGNGVVEEPESCDDIITLNGNGCNSTCQIEPGFTCVGKPSVCEAKDRVWAKRGGGTNSDVGNSIAVDSEGNVYTVGTFNGSINFDGGFNLSSAGSSDIFITKQSSGGTYLRSAKAGGTNIDQGNGITVDNEGNVYIVGAFAGTATFGSRSVTSAGSTDVYVAKYSTTGVFLWIEQVGSNLSEGGNKVVVSNTNDVYVIGYFAGSVYFGSHQLSAGGTDMFISKLGTSAGNSRSRAKKVGGLSTDIGYGLFVDTLGYVYSVGVFNGTITVGSDTYTSNSDDTIIMKQNISDGSYVWTKQITAAGKEIPYAVISDSLGNVYTVGNFDTDGMVVGGDTLDNQGGNDVYISKQDDHGSFVWAKSLGGIDNDNGKGIGVDANNNVYFYGTFVGTGYFGDTTLYSSGSADLFISKIMSDGTIEWAKKAGGGGLETANQLIVNDQVYLYTIGNFQNTITFGSNSISSAGGNDVFVAKYQEKIPEVYYDIYFDGYKGVSIPNVNIENGGVYKFFMKANNRTANSLRKSLFNGLAPLVSDDISPSGTLSVEAYVMPFKKEKVSELLNR